MKIPKCLAMFSMENALSFVLATAVLVRQPRPLGFVSNLELDVSILSGIRMRSV
jgi:hypothetical protein